MLKITVPRLLITSFIIFLTFNLSAQQTQTQIDKVLLPQILPPSPEPTAFMKAGLGNANLSTGAATASIPLYTIKLKDFTFPISLSYSTQGLKADEVASRTGMGWVLNATGMVSRSVKGMPDEFGTRQTPPAGFPSQDSDPLYTYYAQATAQTPVYDTQADEFQFHVNGLTGTFVLGDSYQAKPTTATNAIINVGISIPTGSGGSIGPIIIRDADGVKYTFGNAYEKTTSTNIAQYDPFKAVTKTAFFLDRIDLPTGEYILFNYLPDSYTVATGISQTLTLHTGGQAIYPNSYTTQQNNVAYNTYYLDNIQVSNGVNIQLTYSSSGLNRRLTGLEVLGQKKYLFEYFDVSTSPYPRFYLTKVRDVTGAELYYSLTYDRLNEVPAPISFEQDLLGFYNGNGRSYLIPPTLTSDNKLDVAFRSPNPDQAKKGTLTSIQYPTGGKEEFFYEANTKVKLSERSDKKVTVALEGPGGGSAGSYSQLTYWKHNVTVPFDQTVTLSCWADDAGADYPADTEHHNVSVWIYEGATMVASRSAIGINTVSSTTVNLLAGHVYSLKMTAEHYTEICHGKIVYDLYQGHIYDTLNAVTPGVRLRQIRYTDPYTNTTHSKYYRYASLAGLKHSTGTSLEPTFVSTSKVRHYTNNGTYVSYTDYTRTIYSTSTANQVYSLYSSPVYYSKVIESDDPDLANGGTEYTFHPLDQGVSVTQLKGSEIPFVGGGQYPTLMGVVKLKKLFDRNKVVVQTEQDDYETMIDISGMPLSYSIRKEFEPNYGDIDRLDAYDVAQLFYGSYWNRIKTKTTTSFAGGATFTQQTKYYYASASNLQPDSVVTTDSKGSTLKKIMRYSNTYSNPGDPALTGYAALVSQNVLAPAVYEASYRNNVLLQERKTFYKTWFSNVISPEKVQMRESPSDALHDVLIYKQYDNAGNPLHLQKASDLTLTYLWDNTLDAPIAEIRNASPDQVAFTSFENGANGNWQVSGTMSTASKLTGMQSFAGSLTKSISKTGIYIVSLWASGTTAPTVNGIAPTASLRATNGWNLYQWKVPMASAGTITVASVSTTFMDEVRLYPEGSEMQSFTYKPFIGVATKTDPNQRITFYEYDTSNRLSLIRDQDNNVIKTLDYHYQQQN